MAPIVLQPRGLPYVLVGASAAFACAAPALALLPAAQRAYAAAGGAALVASLLFATCAWDLLACALLWSAISATSAWSLDLADPSPFAGLVVLGFRCLGIIPGSPGNPFMSLLVPLTAAAALFLPPPVFLPTLLCAMLLPWFLPEAGGWAADLEAGEGAVGAGAGAAAGAAALLAAFAPAGAAATPWAAALAATLASCAGRSVLLGRPAALARPLRHSSLSLASLMVRAGC
jgi:hypothetical protein